MGSIQAGGTCSRELRGDTWLFGIAGAAEVACAASSALLSGDGP